MFVVQVLSLALLSSCGVPEEFQAFNSKAWKEDRYACKGQRAELVDDFEQIRKDLYGQKEYVVRNLLGKPDQEELLKRSERIYYYYIETGDQCADRTKMSGANRIELRLNSLAKVSEINYRYPDQVKKLE